MTAMLWLQAAQSWHRQGLYMGMHWAWWLFWILALVVLAWAFWRLYADRVAVRREAERRRRAEEILRQRFARGEIDEDELVQRLTALQSSRAAEWV
jgi:uncharacterized membrane protein